MDLQGRFRRPSGTEQRWAVTTTGEETWVTQQVSHLFLCSDLVFNGIYYIQGAGRVS